MEYDIRIEQTAARPTAVIAATTTWARFPTLWGELLGEVWAGGARKGCRNIMLYLDDTPSVEIGVEFTVPFALTGRIVASALPAGRVATTVHHGSYADLGLAHRAVADWCAERGEHPTGVRWEVYGPDAPTPWVEISWLLPGSE